tara:strand:+ start:415 stop:792 length:378 start_codon:yes stop_codon:yes gene_type:complete
MSDKEKYTENDPERTLMTLEQLSQTIEVMTSVVNRLRQHLSEQLREQAGFAQQNKPESSSEEIGSSRTMKMQAKESMLSQDPSSECVAKQETEKDHSQNSNREPFVIEIRQQKPSVTRKSDKTLH